MSAVREPLRVERFAACAASVEELWALVGDLTRLDEWTDAALVTAPPRWHEGAAATIALAGREHTWRVLTLRERTWELVAELEQGRVGAGCHVVDEGARTRLVLVATLAPAGSRWKARTVELPAMARRLERWAAAAVRLAGPQ